MKKSAMFLLASTVAILLIASASSVKNETDQLLINEFVVDPQADWDGSSTIDFGDQWFELYNPGISSLIVDNWTLKLTDSSTASMTIHGTIPADGYMTLTGPPRRQNNDGRIELYDAAHNLVDSVSYGDYNDGNISDNAPTGNADSTFNE
jgi:hypothetical protein